MCIFTSLRPLYNHFQLPFPLQENSRRPISPLSTVFHSFVYWLWPPYPICWTRPSSLRRSYGPNTKHSSATSFFLGSVPTCGSWLNSPALRFDSRAPITIPALLFLPNPSSLISIYKSQNMPSWVLHSHSFSGVVSRLLVEFATVLEVWGERCLVGHQPKLQADREGKDEESPYTAKRILGNLEITSKKEL